MSSPNSHNSEADDESEYESEAEEVDFSVCDSEDQSYDNSIDYAIHPVLMNDIKLLKENCPNSNVQHRSLSGISEMDLDISFPTIPLEKIVADAWGLVYGEPVIVRFTVNQKCYLALGDVNKVEVFQRQNSKKCGMLLQLKKIVEEFCRKQFSELTNEIVQEAVQEAVAVNSQSWSDVLTLEMVELFDMGFMLEEIEQAYTLSDGTRDGVVNFILDQRTSSKEGASFIDASDHVAHGSSFSPLEKYKEIPSLKMGFLVQFYHYIEKRLQTLNSFCPICDNAHSAAICMMLKPVLCANPLCIFSYQTLGVMADAADNIGSEPEVINLLIYLSTAAVKSERNGIILSPYPTIIHPSNGSELALHPGNKDTKLLDDILTNIPHVKDMLKYDENELKKILLQKHELCYPLLRWIISSNRSHIVKLPHKMQLDFMGTKHQFMMRNSPPLEDKQFRVYKEKYGSIFAFHGSPIENWHAIIREGLIVASGTDRMLNGSVYGKGIYLSPYLGTAFGYCRANRYDRWKQITNDKKGLKSNDKEVLKTEMPLDYIQGKPELLSCITLCEVIDCPSLKKFENIWTCEESEYVCTRFFFVYDENNLPENASLDTHTANVAIQTKIIKAIADYMKFHI
uniref:PARP catalytic domain-containing protein n=1 Tax=Arion vulgaris TaxID=1028688 RepID=A0A0B6ZET6_9EUPU